MLDGDHRNLAQSVVETNEIKRTAIETRTSMHKTQLIKLVSLSFELTSFGFCVKMRAYNFYASVFSVI